MRETYNSYSALGCKEQSAQLTLRQERSTATPKDFQVGLKEVTEGLGYSRSLVLMLGLCGGSYANGIPAKGERETETERADGKE